MDKALAPVYPEIGAGGFTRNDGTVQFYGRINALIQSDWTVVDLGAGRGRPFETDVSYRRELIGLKGKVKKLIGIDIDPAVETNAYLDEAHVYDGKTMPLADQSVDLIFSDWVLEHIEDPAAFSSEVTRVLRPGGWFCGRTPHTLSLVAAVSRLVPNRLHANVLKTVQPDRFSVDVFPAFYRLNSRRALNRYFPPSAWTNCSYGWTSEPAYHFGSALIARMVAVVEYLKQPIAAENLLVFLQHSPSDGAGPRRA